MFGIPAERVWGLFGLIFVALAVATYRVWKAKALARLRNPKVRYWAEPTPLAQAPDGNTIYVCPQCYETSTEPGDCPNEDHDGTPVRMIRSDYSLLEKYAEMRRLVNPDAE